MLAARELVFVGLEKLGIPYYDSDGNFVLMKIGERAIEIRDRLRDAGVLVRDRSYEIAGCVRVTIGTRDQMRRFLSGDWSAYGRRNRVRHGWRARGRYAIVSRDDSGDGPALRRP